MKFNRFYLFGISFWSCHLGAFLYLLAEDPTALPVASASLIQPPHSAVAEPSTTGKLFEAAEACYQSAQFEEAIGLYLQLLASIEKEDAQQELKNHIYSHLGQAYVFLDDFHKGYEILNRLTESKPSDSNEQAKYLLAVCCRHLKKHLQAIQVLDELVKRPCPLQDQKGERLLSTYEDAYCELAINTFLAGERTAAKTQFQCVIESSRNRHLCDLAKLYLCRISLSEGNTSEALSGLEALCKEISDPSNALSENDPLRLEIAYLQGQAAFKMQAYLKAIEYFEKLLPKKNKERALWLEETLYYLGWCHLKAVDSRKESVEEAKNHFEKAEDCFLKLLEKAPHERVHLALVQCYLSKSAYLKDSEAYAQAEKILLQSECFDSLEAKTYALLLGNLSEMNVEPLEVSEMPFALDQGIVKLQVLVYQKRNTVESLQKASRLLKNYRDQIAHALPNPEDLQEFHYLDAVIACRLFEMEGRDVQQAAVAEQILLEALELYPKGNYADACLNLLATLYLNIGNYAKAEKAFLSIVENYSNSPFAGDALYWGIYCLEKGGKDPSVIQQHKRLLFENYSTSTFAPEVYFNYFSYRQYLQGNRAAIKHLQALREKFPQTPFQITAYYLMGLDYKRELKSAEGRSIRKKNLIKAINHFFKAETEFEELYKLNRIDEEQMPHYVTLRYRCLLERALSNQAVAEDSLAAKRTIYWQYAQELLLQINREMTQIDHPVASYLTKMHSFPQIHQESLYYLVQSYIKDKNVKAANRAIEQILKKYASLKMTKNYYLSCIYYEKGMIEFERGEFQKALEAFIHAEESSQGAELNVNQKLDLWIQQSRCYKALYQTDQAMLILSKVINDNTISSLRVKAMYLRAEIYALQGRRELARKQLEATAKKGGEWANQAKIKLEEEYGTQ